MFQTIFLTREIESQTLLFGKWFLDRKRKRNEEEKEKLLVITIRN